MGAGDKTAGEIRMAYHTPVYLLGFLPASILAYQLAPQKKRWIVLLAFSWLFFWMISGKLLVYLLGTILFTYLIARGLEKFKQRCRLEAGVRKTEKKQIQIHYRRKKRLLLAVGIFGLLAVLGYLKYYNFFARNVNLVIEKTGHPGILEAKNLILPLGISFYTLEAVGYLADVYWDRISASTHLGKLALYLSFFPQLMEGPISSYHQTGETLWQGNSIRSENLSAGCRRILWGLFKKMLIADRLNVLAATVFASYDQYGGSISAAAALAYTIQLYMEFSGAMDMVIGSGRIFGITLPENFCRPFAAGNAAEFWRRWHITLGTWLKTYVFYPVSVSAMVKKWNRFGRKHLGKYVTTLGSTAFCLFPVWISNGLWHGPRWSYLFYGLYYFVILMGSTALLPLRDRILKKWNIRESSLWWSVPRRLKTWGIIVVGELFFRANGLKAGFQMFYSIFADFRPEQFWNGTLLHLGLDLGDYFVILLGCLVVGIVGTIQEHPHWKIPGRGCPIPLARWAACYGMLLAVILFGAYGIGYQQVDLIYAGF